MNTTEIKMSKRSQLLVKVGNTQIWVSYSENKFGEEEIQLSVLKPSKARLVDNNKVIKIEQPTLDEIHELGEDNLFYYRESGVIPDPETKIRVG